MRTLEQMEISPVPWIVNRDIEPDGIIEHIKTVSTNAWVADVDVFMCNQGNARLIAAAPMLYEALREMCEWLADGIKERGSINPHWAKAMDALAAASGESGEGETK